MLPSDYTKWLKNQVNTNLLESDRELGLNVSSRHSNISKIPLPWTSGMVGLFSKRVFPFEFSVFAGTGAAGTAGENGLAINAQMTDPRGLGFDKTKQNLYIGVSSPATGGGRILKVNLDTRIITRVAGDPAKGLALTGTGVITSVAATTTQVTYTLFADTPSAPGPPPSSHSFQANQVVRIVGMSDASLNITGPIKTFGATTITLDRNGPTVSTTLVKASVGTLAVNAGIVIPYNIVFDSNGNMYFPNQYYWNSCILRVDSDGYISRYAGNGRASEVAGNNVHRLDTTVRFASPRGISIDSSNNIYIADTDKYTIRKIDAATNLITTLVGAFNSRALISLDNYPKDGLLGTSVRLRAPTAVLVDNTGSNLYILDIENGNTGDYNGIYRYSISDQKIYVVHQSLFGDSGNNIPVKNARLFRLRGIDIDSSNNLYITDGTKSIKIIDSDGILKAYRRGINVDITWHLALRTPTEIYFINGNRVFSYRL
jgi:hypothetical protein